MTIEFTKHPALEAPTDEEIVILGEADPKLLVQLHEAHEGRIQSAREDPLRHGFELTGWSRMRNALKDYDEVIPSAGTEAGRQQDAPRW